MICCLFLPFLLAGVALTAGCNDRGSPDTTVSAPAFVDVTDAAGIEFTHHNGARGDYAYPETFGSGVAWLDFDDDGWLDLYLVDGSDWPSQDPTPSDRQRNRLYRNQGRHPGLAGGPVFEDVTDSTGAGHGGYGMGVAAADVDGDGNTDLFVTNFGADALLLQTAGRFHDRAGAVGVADGRWGTATGFLDVDLDGDLDLAVVNYVDFRLEENPICRRGSIRTYCDPDRYPPTGDILYRNDGGYLEQPLGMANITEAGGFTGTGRGLGLALADVDHDGDTDLFVANDGGANFLYRNDSSLDGARLAEIGLEAGVRFNMDGRAEAGMGAEFGDVDGDGWPDLVVANFSRETNTLYRHAGGGDAVRFDDETARRGLSTLSFLSLGFGATLFDADGDGDLDLAMANGHVLDRVADIDRTLSWAQSDQLLLNEQGLFIDASTSLGAAVTEPRVSRSLAAGDYDNDGDEDLIITTNGGRPRMLRNEASASWLTLRLVSTVPGNRGALGARVEVRTADGRVQSRQTQGAGSYLAARDPRLHVGLAGRRSASVTVRWPGGSIDRWDLATGVHTLAQGASSVGE